MTAKKKISRREHLLVAFSAIAIVTVVVVAVTLCSRIVEMQKTVDNANKLLVGAQEENKRLRNKLFQFTATLSAHRNATAGDVLKLIAGTE